MDVDRAPADVDVAAAGLLEERVAGDDAAGAPREGDEDVELDAGEIRGLARRR